MELGISQKIVVWLAALLSLLLAFLYLYPVLFVNMPLRDKIQLALVAITLAGFSVLLVRLHKYAVALSWALAAIAALIGFDSAVQPPVGGHDIGNLFIFIAIMAGMYVAVLFPAIAALTRRSRGTR